MKIHSFKYAGRIYISLDELKHWFQNELVAFLTDERTDYEKASVKESLIEYIKIQMSCFEKLEERIDETENKL